MESDKHESELQIYHGSINEDLIKLLKEISVKIDKKHILIKPYIRYGFGGSKLYSIYFSEKEGGSVPFLLKTFIDKKKFDEEKNGLEQFKLIYRYARDFLPFPGEKLSGILLVNHNRDPNNPITLADIMYEKENSEICGIINKTYKDFNEVKRKIKIEDCNIKDKYSWYLRGDKTREIIKKLTDNSIRERKIEFYRQNITNPVYILDNLKENIEMPLSLIHGDLHQNNIVINDDNEPRIIDFAWSVENDIYIDFSLLEISIRYWKSTLLMDYESKDELEETFLCENIECYIDKYKDNQDVKRMIIIVSEIRKQCKEYLTGKYDFNHYLLSQFLILYGLQCRTDAYNPFLVIPFLAKLGDKLIKSEYVNEV